MKALVNGQLVTKATLHQMIYDDVKMGFPAIGFDYGYSVWKPKTIPLLMPKKYYCWGCVGVTGAFMFFHPQTEAYVIGTFNDKPYTSKALKFMLTKIIKPLLKIKKVSFDQVLPNMATYEMKDTIFAANFEGEL